MFIVSMLLCMVQPELERRPYVCVIEYSFGAGTRCESNHEWIVICPSATEQPVELRQKEFPKAYAEANKIGRKAVEKLDDIPIYNLPETMNREWKNPILGYVPLPTAKELDNYRRLGIGKYEYMKGDISSLRITVYMRPAEVRVISELDK